MNREGDLVKINAYGLNASAPGSDAARQVTLNTLNDNDYFPKATPPKKNVTLIEMPKYNGNLEQSAINVSINKQKKYFMRRTDNDYKTLIRDLKHYGYYAPRSSNLDMHNIKLNDNGLSTLPRKNIR
jgi:hypothetical protein